MERITSPSNHPARVTHFRPEQIAHRSTWAGVPDKRVTFAASHAVHVVPHGASTLTVLNPVDPATVADPADDGFAGYVMVASPHPVHRAGRRY